MKQSIVKIATVVWVIGFGLTILGISPLAVPPIDLPLYLGLACIAIIPVVLGSYRHRIFGIVAVAGSLMLAFWDFEAGLRNQAKIDRFKLETNQASHNINPPPAQK